MAADSCTDGGDHSDSADFIDEDERCAIEIWAIGQRCPLTSVAIEIWEGGDWSCVSFDQSNKIETLFEDIIGRLEIVPSLFLE